MQFSACASSTLRRPPVPWPLRSKRFQTCLLPTYAAVTFLRKTDGRLKLSCLSSVMEGVAGDWARAGRLDTHSLRKLSALRHTCQLKTDLA